MTYTNDVKKTWAVQRLVNELVDATERMVTARHLSDRPAANQAAVTYGKTRERVLAELTALAVSCEECDG